MRTNKGIINKLREGLKKTRTNFFTKLSAAVTGKVKLDDDMLEEIEEILISADVGVKTALNIVETVRDNIYVDKKADAAVITEIIKTELIKNMSWKSSSLNIEDKHPAVIMVVGVNGVGKTTTIGKLASKFTGEGKKVMLAACDTFRAAAIEQLEIWASRNKIGCVKHASGSDPGAVVFDAITSAVAGDIDILIIDTAGRLHTKVNLMEEIKKIDRVIKRQIPEAPHEVLLVLDATTGQNAIQQAQIFNADLGITGIVMAKMDGTAKGGIIFAVTRELNIPIKFIGIGEQIEDLRKFVPEDFVEALFS